MTMAQTLSPKQLLADFVAERLDGDIYILRNLRVVIGECNVPL